MNEYYINKCLRYAEQASDNEEVPVGTVIIDLMTYKVIGFGYNYKEKKKNCLCHAEIMAINMACKKKNSKILKNCTIYSTLEPCLMCLGAINEAQIDTLYFGTKNNKNNHFTEQLFNGKTAVNMQNEKCSKILSEFFKKRRN